MEEEKRFDAADRSYFHYFNLFVPSRFYMVLYVSFRSFGKPIIIDSLYCTYTQHNIKNTLLHQNPHRFPHQRAYLSYNKQWV